MRVWPIILSTSTRTRWSTSSSQQACMRQQHIHDIHLLLRTKNRGANRGRQTDRSIDLQRTDYSEYDEMANEATHCADHDIKAQTLRHRQDAIFLRPLCRPVQATIVAETTISRPLESRSHVLYWTAWICSDYELTNSATRELVSCAIAAADASAAVSDTYSTHHHIIIAYLHARMSAYHTSRVRHTQTAVCQVVLYS